MHTHAHTHTHTYTHTHTHTHTHTNTHILVQIFWCQIPSSHTSIRWWLPFIKVNTIFRPCKLCPVTASHQIHVLCPGLSTTVVWRRWGSWKQQTRNCVRSRRAWVLSWQQSSVGWRRRTTSARTLRWSTQWIPRCSWNCVCVCPLL